jgi:photosystem II stability/assembly factor-like uncharacterized protein
MILSPSTRCSWTAGRRPPIGGETPPVRWTIPLILVTIMLLAATDLFAQGQEPWLHRDDVPPPAPVEKVRARMQWKYDRVTWPNGEIPIGARARATLQAREQMQLYTPREASARQQDLVWRNVGPFNIGGRILSVAVNPKNPRTIYIGAADGGVWKSLDEGASWVSVSDDFPTQAMGALAIDPVDTNTVYAGTGEANFSTGRMFDGGGMMKSTDGGATWRQVGDSTLPPYARASMIVIDPRNPAVLHAAIPDGVRDPAQAGIYTSTDAGETWTLRVQGRMSDLVMNHLNPDILYTHSSKVFDGATATRYGMLKSTDAGATWSSLDVAGIVDSTMGRTSIALCAAQPDVLYIGVSEVVGDGRTWLMGVFKSTDAGATWTKLIVPFDYMVSQGWYDNIMGVHPVNPDIVYAGGVKLIRSSDGGATWTRIPDQGYGGILHVDQHAIAFNPLDPDRVYVGNDGGFFIGTGDGANWTKSDLGLSITQFVGGAMHPTNDAFLLGGTQDNGTMLTAGPPMWDHVLYGDGGNGAINPFKPNILFTTKENLKFWRSEDYGRTWTEAMGGLPPEGSLFYIDYAMDLRAPSTLYLGTYRLYKTTDDGRSWRSLATCPFASAGGGCYYITAVSVAPYSSDIVLAAAPGQVGVSTDAGVTWTITRDQLPLAYVSAVRTFAPDTIYATIMRYGLPKVWISTDRGATFADITGNLPDIPVNDIIALDNALVVGTDIGTFISEDGGQTWQRFGTGLPALSVQKLRYNERTGTLRAITHGRGMYDLTWRVQPDRAPVFLSAAATAPLELGQPFIYAPVVDAQPAATFSVDAPPPGLTVDPQLGTVTFTATAPTSTTVTLRARNSAGETTQQFPLEAGGVPLADWRVRSSRILTSNATGMRLTADGSLWVTRDSGRASRTTIADPAAWVDAASIGSRASVAGIHAFDAQRAVIGTQDGRILRTSDGGATWSVCLATSNARFGNIFFWNDRDGMAVTVGALDSADIYRTTDGGATWTLQPEPRPYARQPIDHSLTFFDDNNGWFASSNVGQSPMTDASVLRTTDGGRTWQPRATGTRGVSSMSFVTPLRGYLVDEVQGRIRRTISGGVAWSTTFYPMNGLRNVSVWADRASSWIWITSDTSSWVSSNAGETWTRTQMVPVGSMKAAVFTDSARGWAISSRGIVQELLRNPLVGVTASSAPVEHRLASVWPNPVTARDGAASVSFTLERGARVALRVYNSAGREVALVTDTVLPAGEHMAVWNAGDAPNGVYFVTLEAAGRHSTARVVLAR